jgi:DNA-binding IclR family transcriptional regulator
MVMGRPARNDETEGSTGHGGIQSLDSALSLLQILAGMSRPATLSELSRAAGMTTSKVHRYLASFINAGLVMQRHRSGRYELGKGALDLGLAAMARDDLINRAADRLEDIVDATGAAALVAIWGPHGPTVVRWERTASFVITPLALGTVMPVLNSATGRIFLAFGPQRMVWRLAEEQIARALELKLSWPDLEPGLEPARRMAEKVRAAGHSAVDGRFIPGLKAISAPILNWQGEAEAALTITTGDQGLLEPDGPALELLIATCRELSALTPQDGPAMAAK